MDPSTRDFGNVPRKPMSKPGGHGADLSDLARYLLTNGPRRVLPASRRVRVILNRATIVDCTDALHVWEHDAYPQFYVRAGSLKNCSEKNQQLIRSDGLPRAAIVQITVAGTDGADDVETNRALRFEDDKSLGALAGLLRLEFGSMDQWLEEDTPIYVHPKDPFKRVDTLHSTRPVEVKVDGQTVAKSAFSVHLHETGLPVRYYLPLASVDYRLLRASSTITKCPYKGDAEYYSIVVSGKEFADLAWYYRQPTQESVGVAGLVCFYNEKVDIFLDGQLLERPTTYFS